VPLFPVGLALFFFCLLFPAPPRAALAETAPPASVETAEESLALIWATRTDDLTALGEEILSLQRNAETLASPLMGRLRTTRSRFARLSGIFQASRGHPAEQLTLVRQMRGLYRELQAAVTPLQGIADIVGIRLEEIAGARSDLDVLFKESAAEGVNLQGESGKESQGLKKYLQALAEAEQRLKSASARLDRLLSPARISLDRMGRAIADLNDSLVGIWEAYYFTPSETTLEALLSTPALLADWAVSLKARLAFAYPQSLEEWLESLRAFLVAVFPMVLLGWLGLRGADRLPAHWRRACAMVIRRAWVWMGLGLAVLMAAGNRFGGVYFGFVLLGSLVLVAGIASMSWRLRLAAKPVLERKPSPLTPLCVPAALGMFMLFSDLPPRILGILWGIAILAFLIVIFRLNRAARAERSSLPLLEAFAYGCAFYLGFGSFCVAVAGYARIAILLFMFLFALVNAVILGSALTDLLDILAGRLFSRKKTPVRLAVAEAVARPAAWLLALLCAAPWLWAAPGAFYLIDHALSANYTVGEASIDSSRILLLILCFFLVRAFIRLGQTSLDHLPERMPYIERGVIPPLRNVLAYGVWGLFLIFCLALFGVDFTSLAVVAGGLSVGIGFGLQNLFSNMVSGIMLIFGRTLLVGDYVEVAGAAGTVRAINIRSTTIETPDRALVYVPNSSIMAGQFVNWTRNSRTVRRSISIGVAYGSPTGRVAELLVQAAAEHPHVLSSPAPIVYFQNFGDSSLEFQLFFVIDDFDNAARALSDVRLSIDRLFDEHGIEIPFPQITVRGVANAGEPAAAHSVFVDDGRLQNRTGSAIKENE
jgi:small-conductance mechanosensitive channel